MNTNNSWLVSCLQIIFYVVVSIGTVTNLYITNQNNKLIFKPAIGVVDVDAMRILQDKEHPNLDEALGGRIIFKIGNTGSLPAKNVKISVRGKIGNTTLPFTENENVAQGVVMVQDTKYSNTVNFHKEILARMKAERLIYKISLSYADFENYQSYQHDQFFEVRIQSESPFQFGVFPISEVENF